MGVDNFIASVGHYAKNTECSLAQVFRELSLYAYKWVLGHIDRRKAHRIHRNVLCHSFFWLAFAKAYADRSKPERNKYDSKRMARNLAQGQTAMLRMGDPLDYEGTLFVTLEQLFDDVRRQNWPWVIPAARTTASMRTRSSHISQNLLETKRMTQSGYWPACQMQSRYWTHGTHGTATTIPPDTADVTRLEVATGVATGAEAATGVGVVIGGCPSWRRRNQT